MKGRTDAYEFPATSDLCTGEWWWYPVNVPRNWPSTASGNAAPLLPKQESALTI